MARAIHNIALDTGRRCGQQGTATLTAKVKAKTARLRIAREHPSALDLAARFDAGFEPQELATGRPSHWGSGRSAAGSASALQPRGDGSGFTRTT